ncbi:hypothetical protein TEA_005350 [Camellia sinensis var. sinensis]|uniref:DUF547 domain-containing protein n=1 Tax=Camellia sinensis var. sinensis TaxID=542762 RepID=A0A4S4D731_CAMSN|nr:hypothetical protein TEA_005350 [Camellia sinensis var. sinensis]
MLPTMNKTSVLRSLKDHLHQCPSKLSEEMVRCMAAVYCWLGSSVSANPTTLKRSGISEDRDWSCKSMVEISSISTDKNHFSRASYAINNYRVLVEQLEKVNVAQMETNAKIAFWVNTYNSLVMHAYLAYGIPHSSLRRLALFHKAAYNISGHIVSANAIEQSIFCFRTPRVGRWFEIVLSSAMRKRSGEERQRISSKFGLRNSQSLVCFALCTGAFSDPALKVYTASNVKDELEVAKREFLQAKVVVKKSKKVFLPKVLERFVKEASIASDDLINWVAENVDKKLRDSILKSIDRKTSRKASQVIEWLPYDSRFSLGIQSDVQAYSSISFNVTGATWATYRDFIAELREIVSRGTRTVRPCLFRRIGLGWIRILMTNSPRTTNPLDLLNPESEVPVGNWFILVGLINGDTITLEIDVGFGEEEEEEEEDDGDDDDEEEEKRIRAMVLPPFLTNATTLLLAVRNREGRGGDERRRKTMIKAREGKRKMMKAREGRGDDERRRST